jgi:hypothetical protein
MRWALFTALLSFASVAGAEDSRSQCLQKDVRDTDGLLIMFFNQNKDVAARAKVVETAVTEYVYCHPERLIQPRRPGDGLDVIDKWLTTLKNPHLFLASLNDAEKKNIPGVQKSLAPAVQLFAQYNMFRKQLDPSADLKKFCQAGMALLQGYPIAPEERSSVAAAYWTFYSPLFPGFDPKSPLEKRFPVLDGDCDPVYYDHPDAASLISPLRKRFIQQSQSMPPPLKITLPASSIGMFAGTNGPNGASRRELPVVPNVDVNAVPYDGAAPMATSTVGPQDQRRPAAPTRNPPPTAAPQDRSFNGLASFDARSFQAARQQLSALKDGRQVKDAAMRIANVIESPGTANAGTDFGFFAADLRRNSAFLSLIQLDATVDKDLAPLLERIAAMSTRFGYGSDVRDFDWDIAALLRRRIHVPLDLKTLSVDPGGEAAVALILVLRQMGGLPQIAKWANEEAYRLVLANGIKAEMQAGGGADLKERKGPTGSDGFEWTTRDAAGSSTRFVAFDRSFSQSTLRAAGVETVETQIPDKNFYEKKTIRLPDSQNPRSETIDARWLADGDAITGSFHGRPFKAVKGEEIDPRDDAVFIYDGKGRDRSHLLRIVMPNGSVVEPKSGGVVSIVRPFDPGNPQATPWAEIAADKIVDAPYGGALGQIPDSILKPDLRAALPGFLIFLKHTESGVPASIMIREQQVRLVFPSNVEMRLKFGGPNEIEGTYFMPDGTAYRDVWKRQGTVWNRTDVSEIKTAEAKLNVVNAFFGLIGDVTSVGAASLIGQTATLGESDFACIRAAFAYTTLHSSNIGSAVQKARGLDAEATFREIVNSASVVARRDCSSVLESFAEQKAKKMRGNDAFTREAAVSPAEKVAALCSALAYQNVAKNLVDKALDPNQPGGAFFLLPAATFVAADMYLQGNVIGAVTTPLKIAAAAGTAGMTTQEAAAAMSSLARGEAVLGRAQTLQRALTGLNAAETGYFGVTGAWGSVQAWQRMNDGLRKNDWSQTQEGYEALFQESIGFTSLIAGLLPDKARALEARLKENNRAVQDDAEFVRRQNGAVGRVAAAPGDGPGSVQSVRGDAPASSNPESSTGLGGASDVTAAPNGGKLVEAGDIRTRDLHRTADAQVEALARRHGFRDLDELTAQSRGDKNARAVLFEARASVLRDYVAAHPEMRLVAQRTWKDWYGMTPFPEPAQVAAAAPTTRAPPADAPGAGEPPADAAGLRSPEPLSGKALDDAVEGLVAPLHDRLAALSGPDLEMRAGQRAVVNRQIETWRAGGDPAQVAAADRVERELGRIDAINYGKDDPTLAPRIAQTYVSEENDPRFKSAADQMKDRFLKEHPELKADLERDIEADNANLQKGWTLATPTGLVKYLDSLRGDPKLAGQYGLDFSGAEAKVPVAFDESAGVVVGIGRNAAPRPGVKVFTAAFAEGRGWAIEGDAAGLPENWASKLGRPSETEPGASVQEPNGVAADRPVGAAAVDPALRAAVLELHGGDSIPAWLDPKGGPLGAGPPPPGAITLTLYALGDGRVMVMKLETLQPAAVRERAAEAADVLGVERTYRLAKDKDGLDEGDLREAQDLAAQMRRAGLGNRPYVSDIFYASVNLATLPEQGIKVRVADADTPAGRSEILTAFLTAIKGYDAGSIQFKIGLFMKGMKDVQEGKFITIYPKTPEEAFDFMRRLDDELMKARGGLPAGRPASSDFGFGRSGLISWRAGAFKGTTIRRADGLGLQDNRNDRMGNLLAMAEGRPEYAPFVALAQDSAIPTGSGNKQGLGSLLKKTGLAPETAGHWDGWTPLGDGARPQDYQTDLALIERNHRAGDNTAAMERLAGLEQALRVEMRAHHQVGSTEDPAANPFGEVIKRAAALRQDVLDAQNPMFVYGQGRKVDDARLVSLRAPGVELTGTPPDSAAIAGQRANECQLRATWNLGWFGAKLQERFKGDFSAFRKFAEAITRVDISAGGMNQLSHKTLFEAFGATMQYERPPGSADALAAQIPRGGGLLASIRLGTMDHAVVVTSAARENGQWSFLIADSERGGAIKEYSFGQLMRMNLQTTRVEFPRGLDVGRAVDGLQRRLAAESAHAAPLAGETGPAAKGGLSDMWKSIFGNKDAPASAGKELERREDPGPAAPPKPGPAFVDKTPQWKAEAKAIPTMKELIARYAASTELGENAVFGQEMFERAAAEAKDWQTFDKSGVWYMHQDRWQPTLLRPGAKLIGLFPGLNNFFSDYTTLNAVVGRPGGAIAYGDRLQVRGRRDANGILQSRGLVMEHELTRELTVPKGDVRANDHVAARSTGGGSQYYLPKDMVRYARPTGKVIEIDTGRTIQLSPDQLKMFELSGKVFKGPPGVPDSALVPLVDQLLKLKRDKQGAFLKANGLKDISSSL